MPEYVKKGDCSYCGAANVINLRGAKNGVIVCEACGAKMSVGDFAPAVHPAPRQPIETQKNIPLPRQS